MIGYGLFTSQPLWGVVGGLVAIARAIRYLKDGNKPPFENT
jgi:hypothetical protein